MSHHKAAGKTRQHVSPAGKSFGVKAPNGQTVTAGSIIVRQKGTKFNAGKGTKVSRDHSVFALNAGVVKFGKKLGKSIISVVS